MSTSAMQQPTRPPCCAGTSSMCSATPRSRCSSPGPPSFSCCFCLRPGRDPGLRVGRHTGRLPRVHRPGGPDADPHRGRHGHRNLGVHGHDGGHRCTLPHHGDLQGRRAHRPCPGQPHPDHGRHAAGGRRGAADRLPAHWVAGGWLGALGVLTLIAFSVTWLSVAMGMKRQEHRNGQQRAHHFPAADASLAVGSCPRIPCRTSCAGSRMCSRSRLHRDRARAPDGHARGLRLHARNVLLVRGHQRGRVVWALWLYNRKSVRA